MKSTRFGVLFFALLVTFCGLARHAFGYVNGADVSWLTQMEASGYKFYNSSGVQQDLFQILKGYGITCARLRVWVNPSGGWCNQADVVKKAVRAKNAGYSVMIDFHYSDTWADPAHQAKPGAWSSHGISQLYTDVWQHTTDVLTALQTAGVTPTMVQVGNETDDGMLWEDGRASTHISQFAGLITSGYNAVKGVFPSATVIVHISRGYDNARFRSMFDRLTANNAKYDAIGMSLYPSTSNWQTLDSECLTNMQDMKSRYGKQVLLSEIGMDYTAASTSKSFIADIVAKAKSVGALGVFYWEPEAYNWVGYTKGAFDTTGKPTIALEGFGGSGSSGGGTIADGTYHIRNRANGLYLDNLGSTTNGSNVGMYSSSTSNNQKWQVVNQGNGYYKLICVTGSMRLDSLGHTGNGSTVGQWADSTSTNQQWQLQDLGTGYYKIINRANGLRVDSGGATTNGSSAVFWSDSTSNNQQWQFGP